MDCEGPHEIRTSYMTFSIQKTLGLHGSMDEAGSKDCEKLKERLRTLSIFVQTCRAGAADELNCLLSH